MTLTAKRPKGEDFPPIEAGTYQGVCYSVIDLGTQHTTYEGTEKETAQILITWEIPAARIEIEGQDLPRAISKRYTNSLGKKATLFQHLESWRGKAFTEDELGGFQVDDVLGANCLVTIINDTNREGKLKAKVASVAHLVKGMAKLKPENLIVSYNMQTDGIDEIPPFVPNWVKDIIKESMEYKAIHKAQMSSELAAAQAAYGVSNAGDSDGPLAGDEIPF